MAGIFISYRRDDTAGHAGRLYDRLVEHFGRERVFMDVDTIEPGQDFVEVIGERVRSSGAVVVLIGKEWLLADASGRNRLNDPTDFVRLEIASSLEQGTPVIPVLVEDASMPRAEDLPQPLQALSRHQALTISDARFHAEVADLIRVLQQYVAPRDTAKHLLDRVQKTGRWLTITAAAVVICILTSGVYWWQAEQDTDKISGRWKAELFAAGEKPLSVLLDLQVTGTKLLGTVSYPTGESGIRDGTRDGNHISFQTQHVPQFETQPVVIRFEGELAGNKLRLVMQTDQNSRRLTAVRTQ
jgi:TIR domain